MDKLIDIEGKPIPTTRDHKDPAFLEDLYKAVNRMTRNALIDRFLKQSSLIMKIIDVLNAQGLDIDFLSDGTVELVVRNTEDGETEDV